jgi:hypothetical protein
MADGLDPVTARTGRPGPGPIEIRTVAVELIGTRFEDGPARPISAREDNEAMLSICMVIARPRLPIWLPARPTSPARPRRSAV